MNIALSIFGLVLIGFLIAYVFLFLGEKKYILVNDSGDEVDTKGLNYPFDPVIIDMVHRVLELDYHYSFRGIDPNLNGIVDHHKASAKVMQKFLDEGEINNEFVSIVLNTNNLRIAKVKADD